LQAADILPFSTIDDESLCCAHVAEGIAGETTRSRVADGIGDVKKPNGESGSKAFYQHTRAAVKLLNAQAPNKLRNS
jgi:hypothetical protein